MDYKDIKKLIDDMGNSNLDSLEIEFPEGIKISMTKNTQKNVIIETRNPNVIEGSAPMTVPTVREKQETSLVNVKKEEQQENYKIVKSPMVGTFYESASPEAEPYVKVGDKVISGENVDIKVGNALPIMNIPVGTVIHNIELRPGKGAALARSAGTSAQILGREGKYVMIRLSSGEQRKVLGTCMATVGVVGNEDASLVKLGKAGRKRHMGIRPTVRGSVMNPNDHPHGGGEGRAPVGRKAPLTPWGKPALGYKTRNNKKTDKFIVRRRNSK